MSRSKIVGMQWALELAKKDPRKEDLVKNGYALLEELTSKWSPLYEADTDKVLDCAIQILNDQYDGKDWNYKKEECSTLDTLAAYTRSKPHTLSVLGALLLGTTDAILIIACCLLSATPGGAILIPIAAAAFVIFGGAGLAMIFNEPVRKTANAITFFSDSAEAVPYSDAPIVQVI